MRRPQTVVDTTVICTVNAKRITFALKTKKPKRRAVSMRKVYMLTTLNVLMGFYPPDNDQLTRLQQLSRNMWVSEMPLIDVVLRQAGNIFDPSLTEMVPSLVTALDEYSTAYDNSEKIRESRREILQDPSRNNVIRVLRAL